MSKATPYEDVGMMRAPPPDIGAWKSFGQFLYNGEKGTVCGRTGLSPLLRNAFRGLFCTGRENSSFRVNAHFNVEIRNKG
jgi:hypothetical protein